MTHHVMSVMAVYINVKEVQGPQRAKANPGRLNGIFGAVCQLDFYYTVYFELFRNA